MRVGIGRKGTLCLGVEEEEQEESSLRKEPYLAYLLFSVRVWLEPRGRYQEAFFLLFLFLISFSSKRDVMKLVQCPMSLLSVRTLS